MPKGKDFKPVTDPERIEHFRERLFYSPAERAGIKIIDVEAILKANGFQNLRFEATPPASVVYHRALCDLEGHASPLNAVDVFRAIVRINQIFNLNSVADRHGLGMILDLASKE